MIIIVNSINELTKINQIWGDYLYPNQVITKCINIVVDFESEKEGS